jgi:hypothetical protein
VAAAGPSLDRRVGEIIEADGSTTCVVRLSQRVLINADGAVRVDPEALPFRPKECMKDL